MLTHIKSLRIIKKLRPPRALPAYFHDHQLQPPLGWVFECHLGPDSLLLYTDDGNIVHLLEVVDHNQLKGQAQQQLAKKLDPHKP